MGIRRLLGGFGLLTLLGGVLAEDTPNVHGKGLVRVGVAARDITPEPPIWLAGYAARNRPADKVDAPLVAQALAFADDDEDRFILLAVDNCEPSREFNQRVLVELETQHGLRPGEVMIVPSHTHSAPVVPGALSGMYPLSPADQIRLDDYAAAFHSKLVEVVSAALDDLRPARLEHATGRATFAMNRRVYREGKVNFGENPDGPADREVPVLKVLGEDDSLRAVLFGYACHATSIHGDDFYVISPDFPGYARRELEALLPGTTAMFVPGMGADINPSPRGSLLDAKRHGLELAGTVMGVLNRPMRPVRGGFAFAYTQVDLPIAPPPSQAQLVTDAESSNPYVRHRAKDYLKRLEQGETLPEVSLPVAVLRFGTDLTFVAMAGEVVVDYALALKRQLAADYPWTIGYAYEVPCYIPSRRILLEGGYEADSSLVYYGIYGPFQARTEPLLLERITALVDQSRPSR